MAGRKRNRVLQWSDVQCRLHMRVKDVAAELKVPIAYLRHLCHENGHRTWPGKRVRYMQSIGENMLPEIHAPEGSSMAGLAGPFQLANIPETEKKEEEEMTMIQYLKSIGEDVMMPWVDAQAGSSSAALAGPSQMAKMAETNEEEDDMTRIQLAPPAANPPPGRGKELVTLNLIDKVGLSSSSKRN